MIARKTSPLVAGVPANRPCTPLQRLREEEIQSDDTTADVFYTPISMNTKPLMDKTNVKANTNARPPISKLPRPTSQSASPSPKSSKSSPNSITYVPTASRLAVRGLHRKRSPSPSTSLPSPAASRRCTQFEASSNASPRPQRQIPIAKDKPLPSPPIVQVIGASPKRSSRTLIDAQEKPLLRSAGTLEEGEWPPLSPQKPLRSKTPDELRLPSHQTVTGLKRSSTTTSVTSTVSSNASIRTAKTCVTQKARSPVTVTFSRASAASSPNLSRTNTPLKTEFSSTEKDPDKEIVNFSRPHSMVSETGSPPSHLRGLSSSSGLRTVSWSGPITKNHSGNSGGEKPLGEPNTHLYANASTGHTKPASSASAGHQDAATKKYEENEISRVRTLMTRRDPATPGPKLIIKKGTHKILTGEESSPNLLRSSPIIDEIASDKTDLSQKTTDQDSPSKSSTSSHYRKASPHANLLINTGTPKIRSIPVASPKASSNMTVNKNISSTVLGRKTDEGMTLIPITSLSPGEGASKTSQQIPLMRTKDKIISKFQRKEHVSTDSSQSMPRLKRLNIFKKRSSTPNRPPTPPSPAQMQTSRLSGPPLPRRNSARLRVVAPSTGAWANGTPPKVPRKALDSPRLHNPAYTDSLRAKSGNHDQRGPAQALKDKPPPTPPKDTARKTVESTAPRKVAHTLLQHAKALPSNSPRKAQLLNMAEVLVKTIVASNEAEVSRVRAEEGAKQARIACGVAKGALGVMMGMAKGITTGKRLEVQGDK